MKKVVKICDSCEKQMTDEQRDHVTLTQYNESTGTHQSKFDICPECLVKVKEMFHLAT